MTYLAIIPARGGSKGLPNKNILPLNGLPLIAWTILQAKSVAKIEHVVVSTDDQVIADIALSYGAEVPFIRPVELAMDQTPTEPVMLHALDFYRVNQNYIPSAVILLQPTSPIRGPQSINEAINEFEMKNLDSLLSVCEDHHFYWQNKESPKALYDFKNRPRRQDISNEDRRYRENGSIYITKTENFYQENNRLCGMIGIYEMAEEHSLEIDTLTDFEIISTLMSKNIS